MKESLYYKKLENNKIQCQLCPNNCIILPEKTGVCKVRKNINGKLFSIFYGKPCTVHIDPIEKKPLYHFLPGTLSLSIGSFGCNLHCLHCQNYNISQEFPQDPKVKEYSPEEIVELAIKNNCPSISYTYTDPIIMYEYMIDIAKIAKKNKLKNIIISNGYINEEPLKNLLKYIDAANIDLKAFNENFYKKICGVKLKPVLNSLKILKKIHIEITNLLIPGQNDNMKEIEKMCKWIKENLGDIPIHFSRYFPYYKSHQPITPIETLKKAKQIAEKYLTHVHLGNV